MAHSQLSKPRFDWQGHRGARGLLPENTIPSFIKALELRVNTLEMDVAVSKDGKIIISHEPWMSEHICSKPDGESVTSQEAMTIKVMDLTYEQIKAYDCGSRGNELFPNQVAMAVHKPSLSDVVDEVKKWCFMRALPLPYFNIEIKSAPEGDHIFTPGVEDFVRILTEEIEAVNIKKWTTIQSFDVRPLQLLREKHPEVPLALLIENEESISLNLKTLGFNPDIYSPHYKLLKKRHVKRLHRQGIKVIPWTVNTIDEMQMLIEMGVDGIITDYPNLISEVTVKQ